VSPNTKIAAFEKQNIEMFSQISSFLNYLILHVTKFLLEVLNLASVGADKLDGQIDEFVIFVE
jgi:hypothetical protein